MKSKIAASIFIVGSLLISVVAHAADSDKDRNQPATFVKDSIITVKVKAKLADEKISSLAKVQVDTDNKGIVVLTGNVRTQADADKAVVIAKNTEGVVSVMSHLQIKKDD